MMTIFALLYWICKGYAEVDTLHVSTHEKSTLVQYGLPEIERDSALPRTRLDTTLGHHVELDRIHDRREGKGYGVACALAPQAEVVGSRWEPNELMVCEIVGIGGASPDDGIVHVQYRGKAASTVQPGKSRGRVLPFGDVHELALDFPDLASRNRDHLVRDLDIVGAAPHDRCPDDVELDGLVELQVALGE